MLKQSMGICTHFNPCLMAVALLKMRLFSIKYRNKGSVNRKVILRFIETKIVLLPVQRISERNPRDSRK